jgi:bifunctional NMN adenylyltransferase/nudix hydrolase
MRPWKIGESSAMMNNTVGVVVGRFQVPYLHAGHLATLGYVSTHHRYVLILLGVNPANPCQREPLDYPTRRAMIESIYPHATIDKLHDESSDEYWSQKLDAKIEELFPGRPAILYGNRDSFVKYYSGKHDTHTVEMMNVEDLNGTELRARSSDAVINSVDFRSGVIYAVTHRFPTCYPTVDVAIVKGDPVSGFQVLLGRKNEDGDKWRFPGGFVDPADKTWEAACLREAKEETSLTFLESPRYIASMQVDSYRYRRSEDKLMTTFYFCKYLGGYAVAGDDLDEVKWFPTVGLQDVLAESHKPLGVALFNYIMGRYS